MEDKKIKALIVDDEEGARTIISKLLQRFCPEVDVIATASDVEEAVAQIKKQEPDVVFLDIEMPNYPGYQLVSFFEEIRFEIVFVTAYDQYALKAFELSAVDYLLKPIEIARLKEATKKLKERLKTKEIRENYQVLLETMQTKQLDQIVVPYQDAQKVLLLDSIVAIEAQEAYSCVHTVDGDKYLVSKNLKQFESLLEDNQQFFRTHKSWLVNLQYIEKFNKGKLELELKNGIVAKLSRYKKTTFLQQFI
jgi:two-component system LytT family response regulator